MTPDCIIPQELKIHVVSDQNHPLHLNKPQKKFLSMANAIVKMEKRFHIMKQHTKVKRSSKCKENDIIFIAKEECLRKSSL